MFPGFLAAASSRAFVFASIGGIPFSEILKTRPAFVGVADLEVSGCFFRRVVALGMRILDGRFAEGIGYANVPRLGGVL